MYGKYGGEKFSCVVCDSPNLNYTLCLYLSGWIYPFAKYVHLDKMVCKAHMQTTSVTLQIVYTNITIVCVVLLCA